MFYHFASPDSRARGGGWRVVPAGKGPAGAGGGAASAAGPGAALVVAPPRSVAAVAVCDGEVGRAVPPSLTLSPSGRVTASILWLVPSPAARDRLARLLPPELEVPVAFAYSGLAPPPHGEGADPILARRVRAGERLGVFGVTDGDRGAGLQALVGPRAWLDVISLYARLLDRGAVAEKAAVVDMLSRAGPRALLSLRNEWNEPLTAGEAWLEDGTGRERRVSLAEAWAATLALPGHWRRHHIRVLRRATGLPAGGGGPAAPADPPVGDPALLTPAAHGEAAVSRLRLELRPPTHAALQALWPDGWLAAQEPAVPEQFRPRRWTEGNLIDPLVDGAAFFSDLCRQVDEGPGGGLFLMANWWIDTSLELLPGRTLLSLLERLAGDGTRICLLAWDNALLVETFTHLATVLDSRLLPGLTGLSRLVSTALLKNRLAVSQVNDLPAGGALADACVSGLAGTQHQKLTVLARPDRTVAWCGGIDFNWNRLDGPGHAGEHPYHDVHCRVEGPAADELYGTFRDRWNHHPYRAVDPLPAVPPAGRAPARGSCLVQVARTYPARVDCPHGGLFRPYAPRGDFTVARTLVGALRRARRYVYIEDQCLAAPAVAAALAEAVARPEFSRLIVVLPRLDSPENFFWVAEQAEFLRRAGKEAPGKVRAYWIYQPSSEGGRPIYVHSKVVIIDDVFASIGSVNLSRRGLYNDGEAGVFVVDGATRRGGRRFAVDLRRRLWAEHLGLSPEDPRLDDAVAAAALFETPPPAGRVRPWHPGTAGRVRLPDWMWRKLIDPGRPWP